MLPNVVSDQGLHCLPTECLTAIRIKMTNNTKQHLNWKLTCPFDNSGISSFDKACIAEDYFVFFCDVDVLHTYLLPTVVIEKALTSISVGHKDLSYCYACTKTNSRVKCSNKIHSHTTCTSE